MRNISVKFFMKLSYKKENFSLASKNNLNTAQAPQMIDYSIT